MQRLGGSLSTCFNRKYKEKGSLFQGGYKGKTVDTDRYLSYVAFYVLVKNVLDVYPGGLSAARQDFDDAWEWAKRYPYSNLRSLLSGDHSPVLHDPEGLLTVLIGAEDAYKQEARELLELNFASREKGLNDLMLEHW